MKLLKIALIVMASFGFASADPMTKSMNLMQQGIEQVQFGFINNNEKMIRDGLKQITEGNDMFSEEKVIAKYLPKDRKHLVNVAVNASKRISINSNVIELNLDDKAYTKAAEGYSDMLNACSRCHGIIRSW